MKFPPSFNFQSRSSDRGFTVLELLISIGVIATLAMMVMAGVQMLSGSGAAMKCVGNLRSIGVAFAGYVAEHKGDLPPMSALSDPGNPKSKVLLGQEALMPYLNMPDDFNWKQNSENPSAFGVWICPLDREARPSKTMPDLPRWKATNSYLLNYYIGKAAVNENGGHTNGRTVVKITEIINPNEVWYYADGIRADGGQGRMTEGIVSAAEDAPSDAGLRFRHRQKLHALTVAGNVFSFAPADVRGEGKRFTVPAGSDSR